MTETWNYLRKNWFFNTSEIVPEASAVLNNNYTLFYWIYGTVIILQVISLTCCLIVLCFIISSRVKQKSWDFSDRFPFTVSLLDLIWGTCNLVDSLLIISRKTYPDNETCTALGILLWVFAGYYQTMNVGLVIYMYVKVVWQKQVCLGCGEWKLHVICVAAMALCITIFHPLEAFGCSGFWILHKSTTTSGIILGYYMVVSTTVQAVCTCFGYRSIRNIIEAQKKSFVTHETDTITGKFRHHSIATQCLATFVRIAEIIYCTLAVAAWAFLIQVTFGVEEPITIYAIVVTANSSGWANALGYFYNRRVKAEKARKHYGHGRLLSVSTVPSTTNAM